MSGVNSQGIINYSRPGILKHRQWAIVSQAHPAGVAVGCIRIYALVFNDVFEGVCHEASVAPVVAVFYRAIHQVLRTQGNQDTCGLLELPFQSSNCTEGPTRATITLEDRQVAHELNRPDLIKLQLQTLTCILTSVTRPLSLQSSDGGTEAFTMTKSEGTLSRSEGTTVPVSVPVISSVVYR